MTARDAEQLRKALERALCGPMVGTVPGTGQLGASAARLAADEITARTGDLAAGMTVARAQARESEIMLGLVYAVASYLGFLATFVYLALFSDGVLVPKSVDSGATAGLVSTVAIDVALLLLFGVQHSVMARAGTKRAIVRFIPAHVERATFVLASSVVLVLLMWLWRPLPGLLWHVESPSWAATLWTLNAVGWLGVPLCSLMIDHFDLFGVKQPIHRLLRVAPPRKGFVTPLLYKYVRHPMMSALLIAFWATPRMSAGHMLLSLGMSLYIVVGVHFEERALQRELGGAYVRYQASTPKFVPLAAPRGNQTGGARVGPDDRGGIRP